MVSFSSNVVLGAGTKGVIPGFTAYAAAKGGIRGASSTPAEIYSKPPSELLLRVIFHRETAKKGI